MSRSISYPVRQSAIHSHYPKGIFTHITRVFRPLAPTVCFCLVYIMLVCCVTFIAANTVFRSKYNFFIPWTTINNLSPWAQSVEYLTNRIQPNVYHYTPFSIIKLTLARSLMVFPRPRFREALRFYKVFFLSCSRIKATLTSHMDFIKYPMDVQTLRLQIAACMYRIITDTFN